MSCRPTNNFIHGTARRVYGSEIILIFTICLNLLTPKSHNIAIIFQFVARFNCSLPIRFCYFSTLPDITPTALASCVFLLLFPPNYEPNSCTEQTRLYRGEPMYGSTCLAPTHIHSHVWRKPWGLIFQPTPNALNL